MSASGFPVLFVLPSVGGGGGSHSVVQECRGLSQLGVRAAIATPETHLQALGATYPELRNGQAMLRGFSSAEALGALLGDFDLAVATTFESVYVLKDALDTMPGRSPKTAYYIQDYEPLFHAPGTDKWHRARGSYEALKGALLFAKTHWLQEIVHANSRVPVAKVMPSLDREIYYPGPIHKADQSVTISAMLRPKTPRRAPWRTLRVLERLGRTFGEEVRLVTFGSSRDELEEFGLRPSRSIEVMGSLARTEVASLLRQSDLFLDLSDYQAFGRTGLEAMACACVPLLPALGGAAEFARPWLNAIVLDTTDEEAVFDAVNAYISLDRAAKTDMHVAAVKTSLRYSIEGAALSEWEIFSRFLGSN
jgi:glycosyltransferase involved in cell wall biosynthesis